MLVLWKLEVFLTFLTCFLVFSSTSKQIKIFEHIALVTQKKNKITKRSKKNTKPINHKYAYLKGISYGSLVFALIMSSKFTFGWVKIKIFVDLPDRVFFDIFKQKRRPKQVN